MQCPFCKEQDTKVIDSRYVGDGAQVRRRRECVVCNERFTTYEVVELTLPRIVKNDSTREAFDENKLRRGLLRALEKRAVSMENVEKTIAKIKSKLRATGEREVSTSKIGEWMMVELRNLDEVAYVRFASVYRKFQDINAFKEELKKLEDPRGSGSNE